MKPVYHGIGDIRRQRASVGVSAARGIVGQSQTFRLHRRVSPEHLHAKEET